MFRENVQFESTHQSVVKKEDTHGVHTGHQHVKPQVELVTFDEQGVRKIALSYGLAR